jgi:hypothetical protein
MVFNDQFTQIGLRPTLGELQQAGVVVVRAEDVNGKAGVFLSLRAARSTRQNIQDN